MRGAFIQTLTEIAQKDPRIVLLTGDLGYMAIEPFSQKFPDRFFNVGVAEQNMIGIATGLAEAGYIPFVYSIANFAVLRPYEFIRNGPIAHKLPVRIIGIGGGVEYGHNGISHYGLEDVGVLLIQPDISIIAPADPPQARRALLETWDLGGPVYYRLGKDEKTIIEHLNGTFQLGKVQVLGEGKDVALVCLGAITKEAVAAQKILMNRNIHSSVIVLASVRPLDKSNLAGLLSEFPLVLSVESHYITGGIGSLLSELIVDFSLQCKLVRCGVDKTPSAVTGSQSYMEKIYKLSSQSLADTVTSILRRPKINP